MCMQDKCKARLPAADQHGHQGQKQDFISWYGEEVIVSYKIIVTMLTLS